MTSGAMLPETTLASRRPVDDGTVRRGNEVDRRRTHHPERLSEMIDDAWRSKALALLDTMVPRASVRMLEVGCKNGELTLQLAMRGFEIDATEPLVARLRRSAERLRQCGLGQKVHFHNVECQNLPFSDGQFDVIVARSVLAWAGHPERALGELARVVKPGGKVFFGAENRRRLNFLVDPLLNPALTKGLTNIGGMFGIAGQSRPEFPRLQSLLEIVEVLRPYSFEVLTSGTAGFGPFSILRKRCFPERAGKLIQRVLQSAERLNVPFLRGGGTQYLIVARRTSDGHA